jgi:hypothetical protein
MFIPDPDPDFLTIPDPGVHKAPDPGYGSATMENILLFGDSGRRTILFEAYA